MSDETLSPKRMDEMDALVYEHDQEVIAGNAAAQRTTTDFWDQKATNLEQALLRNSSALILHFLQTASREQITKMASEVFSGDSENVKTSVIATLAQRLLRQ